MKGSSIDEDGDRLVVRPGLGTRGAPLMALIILGGGLAYNLFNFFSQPWPQLVATAGEPMFAFYAVLGVGLTAGAVLWFRACGRPVVFDRRADAATGLARPVRLSEVAAVGLRANESADSATGYEIFLLSPGGDVRLSRVGWTDETDPRAAERAGRTVARFLGVEFRAPVGAASAT